MVRLPHPAHALQGFAGLVKPPIRDQAVHKPHIAAQIAGVLPDKALIKVDAPRAVGHAPVAQRQPARVVEQVVVILAFRAFPKRLQGIGRRAVGIPLRAVQAQIGQKREALSAVGALTAQILQLGNGIVKIRAGEHAVLFQHGFNALQARFLRGVKQRVDGYAQQGRKLGQQGDVRQGGGGFPLGYGLRAHAQLFGQALLGQARAQAVLTNGLGKVHGSCPPS